MAKVFKDLSDVRNNVSTNGFDGSSRHVFSLPFGLAVPVYSRMTLPKGEYKIDIRQLLRTNPIVGVPFTRLKVNYECFYYDLNHAYSSFNQFIAQQEDAQTSVQPIMTKVPYITSFNSFVYLVCYFAVIDQYTDNFYSVKKRLHGSDRYDDKGLSLPRYYSYFAWNNPWRSMASDALRALDMLGYGNFTPLVDSVVNRLIYDAHGVYFPDYFLEKNDELVPGAEPSSISRVQRYLIDAFMRYLSGYSLDTFYEEMGYQTNKLFAFLNEIFTPLNSPMGKFDKSCNIWSVLAYNKYWYSTKRNIYYDDVYKVSAWPSVTELPLPTTSHRYVELFNSDDKIAYSAFGSTDFRTILFQDFNGVISLCHQLPFECDFERLLCMFALKPIPYYRDMYNAFLPSTQFGDVSIMADANDWRKIVFKNSDGSETLGNLTNFSGDSNRSYFTNPSGQSPATIEAQFKFDPAIAISVLEERRANAMQRFTERMLRAGSKTSKNFLAHWGIVPHSVQDYDMNFLGSWDGEINLNTVAATNGQGQEQELGQLGSNGVALVNGSKIHFKSSGFGIIQIVAYITKPCEYDAYGFSRQNQLLDVWDFPYPELMNISLAPMDALTINQFSLNFISDRVVGYQPRFIEHKTDVDLVHGEFYSSAPNRYFSSFASRGTFAHMVTTKYDNTALEAVNWLYIEPFAADAIFLKQADSRQSSDNVFVNCQFDVQMVQPLSVIGLPE